MSKLLLKALLSLIFVENVSVNRIPIETLHKNIAEVVNNVYWQQANQQTVQILQLPKNENKNYLESFMIKSFNIPLTCGNAFRGITTGYVIVTDKMAAEKYLGEFLRNQMFTPQASLIILIDMGDNRESNTNFIQYENETYYSIIETKAIDIIVLQVAYQADKWNIITQIDFFAKSLRPGTNPNEKLPKWKFNRNKTFNLINFAFPPFVYIDHDTNYVSGMEYYLIKYLQKKTGIHFKRIYQNVQFPTINDTFPTYDPEWDGTMSAQIQTLIFQYNIEMTYAYAYPCLTFLVHKPELLPKETFVFHPMQIQVWLCYMVVIIIQSILYHLDIQQKVDQGLALIRIYQLQIVSGNNVIPRTPIKQIVVTTCLISAILTSAYFSASYYIIFKYPRYEEPLKTLDDMINKGIRIAVDGDIGLEELKGLSSEKVYPLVENSKKFMNMKEKMSALKNKIYAIPVYRFGRTVVGIDDLDDYARDSMMILDECFQQTGLVIALKKHSPFKKILDDAIFSENDFDLWTEFMHRTECDNWRINQHMTSYYSMYDSNVAIDYLNLELISSAFYFLILGLIVASLGFIAELIKFKCITGI